MQNFGYYPPPPPYGFYSPPSNKSQKVMPQPGWQGDQMMMAPYHFQHQGFHPQPLYEGKGGWLSYDRANYIFMAIAVALAVSGAGFLYGLVVGRDDDDAECARRRQRNILYLISFSMIICAFLIFGILLVA